MDSLIICCLLAHMSLKSRRIINDLKVKKKKQTKKNSYDVFCSKWSMQEQNISVRLQEKHHVHALNS